MTPSSLSDNQDKRREAAEAALESYMDRLRERWGQQKLAEILPVIIGEVANGTPVYQAVSIWTTRE
jgi:hypothetical protein